MHPPAPSGSPTRQQALLALLVLCATATSLLLFRWQSGRSVNKALAGSALRRPNKMSRTNAQGDSDAFEVLYVPSPSSSRTSRVVVENETIFFINYNVPEEGFNPMHVCAYESAAKHNPDSPVIVLVDTLSPISSPPSYLTREDYPNLHFARVELSHLIQGTPVEALWNSRKFARAKYRIYAMSDILRLAVLIRFGGVYLDSDVITLKALPPADVGNFIVAEDETNANGAVLRFAKGHALLTHAIKKLPQRFDGSTWAAVGPQLLSNSVRSLCGLSLWDEMEGVACPDFSVMRQKTFYPVQWQNWRDFYTVDRDNATEVLDGLKDSYAVHYFSHNLKHPDGYLQFAVSPEQPLYKLFEAHCPVTEETELRKRIGEYYTR